MCVSASFEWSGQALTSQVLWPRPRRGCAKFVLARRYSRARAGPSTVRSARRGAVAPFGPLCPMRPQAHVSAASGEAPAASAKSAAMSPFDLVSCSLLCPGRLAPSFRGTALMLSMNRCAHACQRFRRLPVHSRVRVPSPSCGSFGVRAGCFPRPSGSGFGHSLALSMLFMHPECMHI